MNISIYQLLTNWGLFLIFIPILISFYRFTQRSKELKILSVFLYLILFFDSTNKLLANLGIPNLFIWHIYAPIEFYFYWFIFKKTLTPPLSKFFFVTLLMVFSVIALSNMLFLQGFAQFNSYTRVFESMILIFLAVLLLFQLFRQEESVPLAQKPMFWVASGILLYFSGNLFVFIFSNFLLQYFKDLNPIVWAFNALMNVVTYIFFAVALWKEGRGMKNYKL